MGCRGGEGVAARGQVGEAVFALAIGDGGALGGSGDGDFGTGHQSFAFVSDAAAEFGGSEGSD